VPNDSAVAARLVELLPQFDITGKGPPQDDASIGGGSGSGLKLWWFLVAAILLALQMNGWLF
jgi:hypothetical protein